jgi:hypothetical protein
MQAAQLGSTVEHQELDFLLVHLRAHVEAGRDADPGDAGHALLGDVVVHPVVGELDDLAVRGRRAELPAVDPAEAAFLRLQHVGHVEVDLAGPTGPRQAAVNLREFRRGPHQARTHQALQAVIVGIAGDQQALLLDQKFLGDGELLVGQLVGVEGLAVRARAVPGAHPSGREDAGHGDVFLEARAGGQVAGILFVEHDVQRGAVGLLDVVEVHGDAIAAPAVHHADERAFGLVVQKVVGARLEILEAVGQVGHQALVDRLDETVAQVEPRPEPVGHDQIEVFRAARLHLVEGFGIAVEELRRDAGAVLLLEFGDRLLDDVVFPHQHAHGRRGGLRVADVGRADGHGGRRGRALQHLPAREFSALRLGHIFLPFRF